MGTNWGLFLCDCRRTLALDPERLVLPIAPSVLSFASDPEIDIQEFAARANRERLDRVLIGCCADASLFAESLGAAGAQSPRIHFLNLKDTCFFPHGDSEEAHGKASRLLRAAMECAELDSQPVYNRLSAGNRILIATDALQGAALAQLVGKRWIQLLQLSAPRLRFSEITQSMMSQRKIEMRSGILRFQASDTLKELAGRSRVAELVERHAEVKVRFRVFGQMLHRLLQDFDRLRMRARPEMCVA